MWRHLRSLNRYCPTRAWLANADWSGPGDEIPVDQVTLNFAKVEVSYQQQGADGKAQGGPIVAGWDVKANQKV